MKTKHEIKPWWKSPNSPSKSRAWHTTIKVLRCRKSGDFFFSQLTLTLFSYNVKLLKPFSQRWQKQWIHAFFFLCLKFGWIIIIWQQKVSVTSRKHVSSHNWANWRVQQHAMMQRLCFFASQSLHNVFLAIIQLANSETAESCQSLCPVPLRCLWAFLRPLKFFIV